MCCIQRTKVSFSETTTKIYAILLMVLTFTQNHKEDGENFCGLLRKAELYKKIYDSVLYPKLFLYATFRSTYYVPKYFCELILWNIKARI